MSKNVFFFFLILSHSTILYTVLFRYLSNGCWMARIIVPQVYYIIITEYKLYSSIKIILLCSQLMEWN